MAGRSHTSNFTNEEINPCLEESKLSQKCLERELYDYAKCSPYFLNYQSCMKFWGYIKYKRMKAGISPKMPPKEEREKILKLRKEGITVFSVSD